MAIVSKTLNLSWQSAAMLLSNREITLLFEIFGPFPVVNQFTVRGGLIGLGKSRVLIANQDQLSEALYQYVNQLTNTQQSLVKELINEWECLRTKVVKFDQAERVRFRRTAPSEERLLIKRRLQNYIPIFTTQEMEQISDTGDFDTFSNEISRG